MIFANLFFLLLNNLVISEYCNWSSWSRKPVCVKMEAFCLYSHFRNCICKGVMFSPNFCNGSSYKKIHRVDVIIRDRECHFTKCYEFPYWCEWESWGNWIYNKRYCSRTRKRMCCNVYEKLIPFCLPDNKTGVTFNDVQYRNGTCGIVESFPNRSLEIPSFIQIGIGFIVMFVMCSLCAFCFQLKTKNQNRPVPSVVYPRYISNSESVILNQNNVNIPFMPRNLNNQNIILPKFADNPPSYDNIRAHSSMASPDLPPPSYESLQRETF